MVDGFTVDASELGQLSADLGTVAENAGRFLNSAVQVTARNVKDEAARTVSGRKGLGHAASAIDYEVKVFRGFGVSVLDVEVGYDKDRPAGELGNLVEYGAPGAVNALAPTSDLLRALEANQDDFEKGLSEALRDAEAVLRR